MSLQKPAAMTLLQRAEDVVVVVGGVEVEVTEAERMEKGLHRILL